MTSGNFLGYAALALLLGGLVSVLLEAAAKSPSTLLDLLTDGLRPAPPKPRANHAGRATIGYVAPGTPANGQDRIAA
jgi:hypothetical protein